MRKLLFLLISLGIIGGSVYALFPGLFPDTATFPRVPTGPGTIGSVISKILGESDLATYGGDGTVADSLALSGVSASGYLRDDPECGAGKKFVGINNNGRRDCASIITLLADYGKIDTQGCAATYYRADGTTNSTNTGDTLRAGDIVKTAPGCPMTIVFSDLSTIRLDGDTTVSLDVGSYADGTSIASALLSNGSLWGRILTETGSYSIGTSTIVAGVRGTSISVIQTGSTVNIGPYSTAEGWPITRATTIEPTRVQIVDTVNPGAITIECRDAGSDTFRALTSVSTPSANTVITGSISYTVPPAGCVGPSPSSSLSEPIDQLYDTSPWIRANTLLDISRMYRLLALSGTTITSTKRAQIERELAATRPTPAEATPLCPDNSRWWGDRHGCQLESVLAIADYALPSTLGERDDGLYVWSQSENRPERIDQLSTQHSGTFYAGSGILISTTSTGYLQYSASAITGALGDTLSGKTLTFELASPPTSGASSQFFSSNTLSLRRTSGGYLNCTGFDGASCGLPFNGNILSVLLIQEPTQPLIVGRDSATTYLNNTLRKFQISVNQ